MLTRYAKSISSSRSRAMQPPVAGPTFTTPNPDFICPRRAATRVLGLIAGYCDSCCFFSAPKWYIVSSHAALSLAPARQHPQANAASTSSTDPQALSSHNRSHRPLFTPLLRVMALQRHNSAKRAHACRWEMDAFLGDPISDVSRENLPKSPTSPRKSPEISDVSRENLPKSPMFPRKSPEISDVPAKIS